MSVLIKGNVHLPRSCRDCPFNYSGVCIASANCLKTKSFMKARNPDCPIIEIPTPHGRLIDAERLFNIFEPITSFPKDEQIMYVEAFLTAIKQAPTIIEAEVSDNA